MDAFPQKAFVLGAGLGTRLKRLTAQRPKPLIPVCNKPLIAFAFDHLIGAGVKKFVVNTHHKAGVYGEIFPENKYRDVPITFRHEEILLETGGGIKNVADLLDGGPFFVYNGDILTDLPLEKAARHHAGSGNEVTMVLRSSGGPLAVSLDQQTGLVTDIGRKIHADRPGEFLFTGVYIVEPAFIARIPAGEIISVVPVFLDMIRQGAKLGGVVIDEGHWWDLGTREQYLAVHRHLKTTAAAGLPAWVDPSAKIAPGAHIGGAAAIGPGVTVGEGTRLEDCIVWENAEIASGASLRDCIVTAGCRVEGTHEGADF